MAEVLKSIKGDFILSINDVPEIREVFKDFKIEPVTLSYSASKNDGIVGKELLIRWN